MAKRLERDHMGLVKEMAATTVCATEVYTHPAVARTFFCSVSVHSVFLVCFVCCLDHCTDSPMRTPHGSSNFTHIDTTVYTNKNTTTDSDTDPILVPVPQDPWDKAQLRDFERDRAWPSDQHLPLHRL